MTRKLPVDVISLCSAEGEIQPLRVRLMGENSQMIRADISKIVRTEEIVFPGAEAKLFVCRFHVGQVEGILELVYHIRTHTWTMERKNDYQ